MYSRHRAFSVGWRAVVATWIVCITIVAAFLVYSALDGESLSRSRFMAESPIEEEADLAEREPRSGSGPAMVKSPIDVEARLHQISRPRICIAPCGRAPDPDEADPNPSRMRNR
jgi:hypothetical protein